MPIAKVETLRQRQARTKPIIEDTIKQSLSGDMLKNAMAFVS